MTRTPANSAILLAEHTPWRWEGRWSWAAGGSLDSALINSGVVPQQPPRMDTPRAVKGSICRANSSGSMSYAPVAGSGSPALGLTMMGLPVQERISWIRGRISAGPREQLMPMADTPSPSRVQAMLATVVPAKVRPEASKLMVTQMGSRFLLCSRAASTAARTSPRSVMVSKTTRSAPAFSPARTIWP